LRSLDPSNWSRWTPGRRTLNRDGAACTLGAVTLQPAPQRPEAESDSLKRFALALLLTALVANVVAAQEAKPVQLALFDPAQIFKRDVDIAGLGLDLIYGRNADVTGLELGIVNHTTGKLKAVSFSGVSYVEGDFSGWQDSFVNIVKGEGLGLQMAVYNSSEKYTGLQFGFVNVTQNLHGLQIGLLNIAKNPEKKFKILPIVNWAF
jgi:hypothetical protein